MPLNGSGVATQPTGSIYPATGNTLIESEKANVSIADIYSILSTAIYKDGQSITTQRIPFAHGISTNSITERTSDSGVTIDGVLLKDAGITLSGLLSAVAATISGTLTAASIVASGTVAATGVIEPAELTGDADDWEPTGIDTASVIRFSTDARRNITGLAGGTDGRIVILQNVGTFPACFKGEDTDSDEENRFAFAHTLGGGQTMEIIYDGTAERWRAKSIPEPIGTIKDFGMSTLPEGYLPIDQNYSRTEYAALFNEVGTTWGEGDGSTTFGLFIGAGRARISAGQGTVTEAVTESSGNGFTVEANDDKWITGMTVVLSNLSGFTTSASAGPTYYVARISSTNVRLATTLALAQGGSPDVTISGGGTATLTHTFKERTVGEKGGEETHAMSSTELLLHGHPVSGSWFRSTGGSGTPNSGGSGDFATISPPTAGGNAAMNNMQPYSVATVGVRYC
jgi:microcystin-dependent protein